MSPEPGTAANKQVRRYWIQKHSEKSLDGLILVIVAVEGRGGWAGAPESGCKVAADGTVSRFSGTDSHRTESGQTRIAPADLKRLKELLTKLPDDGSRLPPVGRRVLVQAWDGARWVAWIYDRKDIPTVLVDVLRLSASGISAWPPEFRPRGKIEARGYEHGGFLCLSPDGRKILFTGMNGPLQFWDPTTHETLGEISTRAMSPESIAFSPDGATAAVPDPGGCALLDTKNWKRLRRLNGASANGAWRNLHDPRFTPDGRYLVLRLDEPALCVFDTRTWQRVSRLPNVPEDTVQFVPAPRKRLAAIRSKDEVISLWDLARHVAVAELDKGHEISEAVFSPDESLLAVVTTDKPGWGNPRLRLWKTGTGEFVHALQAFEQTRGETVRCLHWSPDGKYVLAATREIYGRVEIRVWSARTGRHLGEFAGFSGEINGLTLLPDGSELVAGCMGGVIWFWDFPAAMKRIREFEDSLQAPEK